MSTPGKRRVGGLLLADMAPWPVGPFRLEPIPVQLLACCSWSREGYGCGIPADDMLEPRKAPGTSLDGWHGGCTLSPGRTCNDDRREQ